MPREFWVKADWDEPWEDRKTYVTAALEVGAGAVVVSPEDVEKSRELGDIDIAAKGTEGKQDVVLLEAGSPSEVEDAISTAKDLRGRGRRTAILVKIAGKELERAAARAGKVTDFLIPIAQDWKVIPLENLIAELQDVGTKVLAGVKDARETKTAIETLEVGADGVLLDPREGGADEIGKVREVMEQLEAERIELVAAKVTRVKQAGMGDRVCVDTSSLMRKGEGMLVGSQSNGLFLVHSETLASEYVETRPFRVNAGAVHAYIKVPEGKTKYLSEIRAGDEVLVVDIEGEARTATVGRAKIERRPMFLVEAEWDGEKIKTLLQNAETVNLVREDGTPVPVTELKQSDEVLVYVEKGGRHFGVKVEETLAEV